MVRRVKETLAEVIAYEANKTKSIGLPRSGYITHIDLNLVLNVSTGTAGGTPKTDGLWRIIKALRIEAEGGRIFYAFPDGRVQKFKQILEYGSQFHEDSLPTAANVTQDVKAQIKLHTGLNPLDPFDPSIPIPADDLSQLKLSVLWGSESDLGDGYTVNSGQIEVTVAQLIFEGEAEKRSIYPEGPAIPKMTDVERSITSTQSDLREQFDLPTGDVLMRTYVMVTDSNDDYSDAEVSELGVVFAREKETPYRVKWDQARFEDRARYGLTSTLSGRVAVDYEDVTGNPLGIDLSGYETGEVKLGFTTVKTGGRIRLLHVHVA